MDPNANLTEQREIASRILKAGLANIDPHDADRLAELVVALDSWLRSGGFAPTGLEVQVVKIQVPGGLHDGTYVIG